MSLILNQIDLICIGIVVVVVVAAAAAAAVVVFASCCMLLLLLLLDLISRYMFEPPNDGDLVLSSSCAGYSRLRLWLALMGDDVHWECLRQHLQETWCVMVHRNSCPKSLKLSWNQSVRPNSKYTHLSGPFSILDWILRTNTVANSFFKSKNQHGRGRARCEIWQISNLHCLRSKRFTIDVFLMAAGPSLPWRPGGEPSATGPFGVKAAVGSRNHGGPAPPVQISQPLPVCSWNTLWLCQNSYWRWWFIVDFPMKHGENP